MTPFEEGGAMDDHIPLARPGKADLDFPLFRPGQCDRCGAQIAFSMRPREVSIGRKSSTLMQDRTPYVSVPQGVVLKPNKDFPSGIYQPTKRSAQRYADMRWHLTHRDE